MRAAHSMAAEWQVVGARVEKAPTWEGGEGGGLLLRIEGVGASRERGGGGPRGEGGVGEGGGEEEGLEGLAEGYVSRLRELGRVVEGGGTLGLEGGVGL